MTHHKLEGHILLGMWHWGDIILEEEKMSTSIHIQLLFLKPSRDTLDLKANVKRNSSNKHTHCLFVDSSFGCRRSWAGILKVDLKSSVEWNFIVKHAYTLLVCRRWWFRCRRSWTGGELKRWSGEEESCADRITNSADTWGSADRRWCCSSIACPEAPGSEGKEGRGGLRDSGRKEGPPFQIDDKV